MPRAHQRVRSEGTNVLKLGVSSPTALGDDKTLLGRKKHVAYTLLRTGSFACATDVARFERVLRTVRLSSGVYRTTYRSRFAGLDRFVAPVLARQRPPSSRLRIHDWAASDGITSLEWYRTLGESFADIEMVSSDHLSSLIEACHPIGTYVAEPGGALLQYIRDPLVVPLAHPDSRAYPLNRLVRRIALRWARPLPDFLRDVSWSGVGDSRRHVRGRWSFSQIPLVHPDVLALAARDSGFHLATHDVFQPLQQPVEVVRTMNILNLSYFTTETLSAGIRAVLASLVEGGLWIVGRTQEPAGDATDATVFRRVGQRAEILAKMGKGSEIESLVSEVGAR